MRQTFVAGMALAAATTGLVTAGTTPSGAVPAAPTAAAAAAPIYNLVGDFAGDSREELFQYIPGTGPDVLVSFANSGGVPGTPPTNSIANFTVNGTYIPIVGNFDADARDEIIWYGQGSKPDYLANFTSFTQTVNKPMTINSVYGPPLVGDFTGDGVDDIFWYTAGAGIDPLWEFNADGKATVVNKQVNGKYQPVVGSFGVDATYDILWFAPGTGQDYMCDFHVGTTDCHAEALSAGGDFQTFSLDIFKDGWGGHDVFWYRPGAGRDYLWDYIAGVKASYEEFQSGVFAPVPGNFLGDGYEDILWMRSDGEPGELWEQYLNTGDGQVHSIVWVPHDCTLMNG